MDKAEAIYILVYHVRQGRRSNAQNKRTVQALKALGLSGNDLILALYHMDVCDREGNPYGGERMKRFW